MGENMGMLMMIVLRRKVSWNGHVMDEIVKCINYERLKWSCGDTSFM